MEISNAKIVGLIVGIIGVALLPLGGLWALNTLFATALEYNLLNWSAVLFSQIYLQLLALYFVKKIESGTVFILI